MITYPTLITTSAPLAESQYVSHTYFPEQFPSYEAFMQEVERIGGIAYAEGPMETLVVQCENPWYTGPYEQDEPDECDLRDD